MFKISIRQSRSVGVIVALLATLLLAPAAQAGGVVWRKDLSRSTREAARLQKPMFVMVEANWCGYCRKMLNETLANPQVAARLNEQFVPVLLNADEQSTVVDRLNVSSLPTILVMDSAQKILVRIEGFQSAAQLQARLAAFEAPVRQAPRVRPQTTFLRAHAMPDTLTAAKQFHG